MLYLNSLKNITEKNLEGFFVGWRFQPSPITHLELLQNSDDFILAIDEKTGKVVGFITAITDKTLFAYIPLLEVLPEYQKQGIGGELLKRMLERLQSFYGIDLLCDIRLQPFYAKFGMQPVQGMLIRNFDNLKKQN
jgi:ribosomal protein S18 acetylase RimI-like enzyme